MIDKNCPYPEFVNDEVSDFLYKNWRWELWQSAFGVGYDLGYRDGIELAQNEPTPPNRN